MNDPRHVTVPQYILDDESVREEAALEVVMAKGAILPVYYMLCIRRQSLPYTSAIPDMDRFLQGLRVHLLRTDLAATRIHEILTAEPRLP